jgi:hypothetical protein
MLKYTRVKRLLRQEGRTREWFCRMCDVPDGSMDLYLSGHRAPNKEIVGRMAETLNCRISDIWDDSQCSKSTSLRVRAKQMAS